MRTVVRKRTAAAIFTGQDAVQPVVPPAEYDCFVAVLCGPRWIASVYPKPRGEALAVAEIYRRDTRIPARAQDRHGLPIEWRPSADAIDLARDLIRAGAEEWRSFALTAAECELLTLGGLVGTADKVKYRPVRAVLTNIVAAADAAAGHPLESIAC